jgi:hypothetical protein
MRSESTQNRASIIKGELFSKKISYVCCIKTKTKMTCPKQIRSFDPHFDIVYKTAAPSASNYRGYQQATAIKAILITETARRHVYHSKNRKGDDEEEAHIDCRAGFPS